MNTNENHSRKDWIVPVKIIFAVFLLTAIGLLALNNPASDGPHGGIVKNAGNHYIEMKNIPDTSFFAYLLDKKLNTISNKGISGEVKFFFPDSTAMDVQLSPMPDSSFTALITPGFYACKITFHASGKDISAMFEKQSQIVLEE